MSSKSQLMVKPKPLVSNISLRKSINVYAAVRKPIMTARDRSTRRWCKERIGHKKVVQGENWSQEGGARRELVTRRWCKERIGYKKVVQGVGVLWKSESK